MRLIGSEGLRGAGHTRASTRTDLSTPGSAVGGGLELSAELSEILVGIVLWSFVISHLDGNCLESCGGGWPGYIKISNVVKYF